MLFHFMRPSLEVIWKPVVECLVDLHPTQSELENDSTEISGLSLL